MVLFLIFSGCREEDRNIIDRPDWGKFFQEKQLDGTFVLKKIDSEEISVFNALRADTGFIPASTFKIFNSLVALQEGVAENVNTVIKWDGKDRGWDKWNRDLDMKEAFKYSAVWYYQELARRVGREKMENHLELACYGNMKTGEIIDEFWLRGEIRISAFEQIQIIESLVGLNLHFDKEIQRKVKKMMLVDSTGTYKLFVKTGWGVSGPKDIGWYVGFVESGGETYIFALNISFTDSKSAEFRKTIAYEILMAESIIE